MIDFSAKIDEHVATILALRRLTPKLETVAKRMVKALSDGAKILWMGNGGSAADCQHLAAEMVGRFSRERGAFPSVALTTDTSVLTSIANDYGYEEIFARQIEALCYSDDIVVGISTSGSSVNVIKGLLTAREMGAYTVGFTGSAGGAIVKAADCCIEIPSSDTARIQEAHILIGHLLCDWVEDELANE